MTQVAVLAKQQGVVAKKLDISVPSHCELLSQQAKQLAASMEGVTLKQPKIRYLSGTTARTLSRPEQIGDDLAFNMSRTVDWENTIQAAWERGVRLQIELCRERCLLHLHVEHLKKELYCHFREHV